MATVIKLLLFCAAIVVSEATVCDQYLHGVCQSGSCPSGYGSSHNTCGGTGQTCCISPDHLSGHTGGGGTVGGGTIGGGGTVVGGGTAPAGSVCSQLRGHCQASSCGSGYGTAKNACGPGGQLCCIDAGLLTNHGSHGGSTGGGGTVGGGTVGGGTVGGSTGTCVDQHNTQECAAWAARGECQANPNFMLTYCSKSCRHCGGSHGGSTGGSTGGSIGGSTGTTGTVCAALHGTCQTGTCPSGAGTAHNVCHGSENCCIGGNTGGGGSTGGIGGSTIGGSGGISTGPVKTPDQCGISGVRHSKIVGGTDAIPGEFPWQVSLLLYGSHHCGGTLINSQWVATASHCFRLSHNIADWAVVLGEFDRTYNDGHEQKVTVSKIVTHAQYDQKKIVNDIALVKLAQPVQTTNYIRPACLPSSADTFQKMSCIVTGWGSQYTGGPVATRLQKVSIPILENAVCDFLRDSDIPNTEICAGYKQGGRAACAGDSGGPLVCFKDGVWKLAGIVSYGDQTCATAYRPSMYTRVTQYLDWIRQHEV